MSAPSFWGYRNLRFVGFAAGGRGRHFDPPIETGLLDRCLIECVFKPHLEMVLFAHYLTGNLKLASACWYFCENFVSIDNSDSHQLIR